MSSSDGGQKAAAAAADPTAAVLAHYGSALAHPGEDGALKIADVGGDLAKALGEVSERLARELDDDWVLLVQSTSASSASYLQLAAELGRSQLDDAKQTQILDAFRASIAYL